MASVNPYVAPGTTPTPTPTQARTPRPINVKTFMAEGLAKEKKWGQQQHNAIVVRNEYYRRRAGYVKPPKYTTGEALTLGQYGYAGLFKSGTKTAVGLFADNWEQQYALDQLRAGKSIINSTYKINPNDLYASRRGLAVKPITNAFVNQYVNTQNAFVSKYGADGAKYKALYGHMPSSKSKYGMLFSSGNRAVVNDASMSAYQNILAEQLGQIGQAYTNNTNTDTTSQAMMASTGQELMLLAQDNKSKKGKWSNKKIIAMEEELGITNGVKQWDPTIMGIVGTPPKPMSPDYSGGVVETADGRLMPETLTPNGAAQQVLDITTGAWLGSGTRNPTKIAEGLLGAGGDVLGSDRLTPNKIDWSDPLSILGTGGLNTLKGATRAIGGLPMGLPAIGTEISKLGEATGRYASGSDKSFGESVDFTLGDAIWADYAHRYYDPFAYKTDSNGDYILQKNPDGTLKRDAAGNTMMVSKDFSVDSAGLSKLGNTIAEDPVSLALDIIGLVPIVGWAVKGASVASLVGRAGRVGMLGSAAAKVERITVKSPRVKMAEEFLNANAKIDDSVVAKAKALIEQDDIALKYSADGTKPVRGLIGPQRPATLSKAARKKYEDIIKKAETRDDHVKYKNDYDERVKAAKLDEVNRVLTYKTFSSAKEYARTLRQALAGNKNAINTIERAKKLGLDVMDPNSAKLIRLSAKFEERTKVLKLPYTVGEGLSDNINALQNQAVVRLPANPVIRATKEVLTFSRRKVYEALAPKGYTGKGEYTGAGKRAASKYKLFDVVVDMPFTGYRWQYTRALNSNTRAFHGDLTSMTHFAVTLLDKIKSYNFSPVVESVILHAHNSRDMNGPNPWGTIENPAFQRTILNDSLVPEDVARLKMTPDQVDFEKTLEMFNKKLLDPTMDAGEELNNAYSVLQQMMHHESNVKKLINSEMPTSSIKYLKMVYAEAMQALRLRPEHLLGKVSDDQPVAGELQSWLKRIAEVNDNWPLHAAEFNGKDAWTHVLDANGDNVFDRITDPKAKQERIDEFIAFIAKSKEKGIFRDTAGDATSLGAPILFIATGNKRKSRFVRVHFAKLDGSMENGLVNRDKLINTEESFLIPRELLHEGGQIGPEAPRAASLIEDAAVNAMADYFPNPHFYSDKVNESGIGGERLNFIDAANDSVIATQGLKEHTLRMSVLSAAYHMRNRIESDLEDIANSNAVLVPILDFIARGQKGGRILRSVVLFTDINAAETHANNRGVGKEFRAKFQEESENPGSTLVDSPFDVGTGFGTIVRDGKTYYAIRGQARDFGGPALEEKINGRIDDNLHERVLYEDLANLSNTKDTFVLMVPNHIDNMLKRTVVEGNNYATQLLNNPLLKGPMNIFKRLVLNMNPRFISANVIGGLTMMMMADPLSAYKILRRAMQSTASKSGLGEWDNLSNDMSVLDHHMAYEIHNNVNNSDMANNINDLAHMSRMKKYGWNFGYTTVRAFEEFVRKNVAKDFLEGDDAFRVFMNGPEVTHYINDAIDYTGQSRSDISRFEAAADMLLNTNSRFYDHDLKTRMRYTTNTVSGNYHNFSPIEQVMRNVLMPFYAWQRHSLAFTTRLPIDHPITTNALMQIGDYGYAQALESGLPEWMYQTVPMPDFISNMFGLTPGDRRLDLGSISPFGATADLANGVTSLMTGTKSSASIFDLSNPAINAIIKSTLNVDPITGKYIPESERRGFGANILNTTMSFPGVNIPKSIVFDTLVGVYNQDAQASKYNTISEASDILKNYNVGDKKSDWRLSIPNERATIRPTNVFEATFNAFFPAKPYNINVERMNGIARDEAVAAALLNGIQSKEDKSKASKFIDGVREWQRKRDYIYNVWLPLASNALPQDQIEFVLRKLESEKPRNVKGFSFNKTLSVLGG